MKDYKQNRRYDQNFVYLRCLKQHTLEKFFFINKIKHNSPNLQRSLKAEEINAIAMTFH